MLKDALRIMDRNGLPPEIGPGFRSLIEELEDHSKAAQATFTTIPTIVSIGPWSTLLPRAPNPLFFPSRISDLRSQIWSPDERPRLACAMFLYQMNETMNLDDQIRRYFGTSDLASVPPQALNAGIEHIRVDLGLTTDRGERFALWALLHALGSAPDLDVIFKTEEDREAARNFMDLIHGSSGA
jgi:hypothetical protein